MSILIADVFHFSSLYFVFGFCFFSTMLFVLQMEITQCAGWLASSQLAVNSYMHRHPHPAQNMNIGFDHFKILDTAQLPFSLLLQAFKFIFYDSF